MLEVKSQKNIIDNLKRYDPLAKEDAYISVSEWVNGEGYDIDLDGKQFIHLTIGEFEAINYLSKTLEYNRS